MEYKGKWCAKGLRFAVVISRFNEAITSQLLHGALEVWERYGLSRDEIDIVWVPGAYEIPFIVHKLAVSHSYHALVCLGAVIRGATPHFDYVAGPLANALTRISIDADIPVLFGVLTVDTLEQAWERSGTKMGNKGAEAAQAAIEMAQLILSINKK